MRKRNQVNEPIQGRKVINCLRKCILEPFFSSKENSVVFIYHHAAKLKFEVKISSRWEVTTFATQVLFCIKGHFNPFCCQLFCVTIPYGVLKVVVTGRVRQVKAVKKLYFQCQIKSLGIRQKVEPQNGCFKKAKHAKISEKQTFLTL